VSIGRGDQMVTTYADFGSRDLHKILRAKPIMNFSIKNNSLWRPFVVSQWFFESIGGLHSIDMYFFNASPPD
jgi:hypothetical protein